MVLHYDFDGFEYEKDLDFKEVRELFADFYAEEYKLTDDERKTIRNFIYNCDLEDALFEFYEEQLHEYFYDAMYQQYKDDCADNDYWKHTDIHGGV